MPNGLFSPLTIQHPMVIVVASFLFAFLGAKDFKHGLFQGLAMLLLILGLMNHWG